MVHKYVIGASLSKPTLAVYIFSGNVYSIYIRPLLNSELMSVFNFTSSLTKRLTDAFYPGSYTVYT